MLINKVIPGLFNGVSQQAPNLRLDTQCELSENVFSTISEGSAKRPPTEHLAALSDKVNTNSFVHLIDRDENEKYIVILTGNAAEPCEIYTLDGTKCTVTADDVSKAYLTSDAAWKSFKACTVADYTVVANTTKTCYMSPTVSSIDKPMAIVNVAKGVAAQDYAIFLDGERAAFYTSGDTTAYESYKASTIAAALYGQLAGLTSTQLIIDLSKCIGNTTSWFISVALEGGYYGESHYKTKWDPLAYNRTGGLVIDLPATVQALYTMLQSGLDPATWSVGMAGNQVYISKIGASTFTYSIGHSGTDPGPTWVGPDASSGGVWRVDYITGTSTIRIAKSDGSDFKFSVTDTYGNQGLIGIKGTAQKFGDLPSQCSDGAHVEITGDPSNNFDNFHLVYSTKAGQAVGVWKETVKQGLQNDFDVATMPVQIVRTAFNTFTVGPVAWLSRRVGDDTSCPPPSFINNKISDIFFYRNRLGILTGENVVLSKAGEFFDFWSSTATSVLDDDPIDISCPTNQVTRLFHAVPFPKSLYLVGAQQQLSLNSGTLAMTPKTVAVDLVTQFELNPQCVPAVAGANIYLPATKGNFSSIREYEVTPDSYVNDAADVTAHVPTYIPKNLVKLTASSIFDMVVALSRDTSNTLYVYKYYWSGDTKAQSAWGKWIIDGDIVSCQILDNWLYLVVQRGTETALERIRLETVSTGTLPFRVHLDRLVSVLGVYSAETKKTTWTLPYADASNAFDVIQSTDGFQIKLATKTGLSTIEAPGDHSANPCWIGKNYTLRFRFSEWEVKAQGSNVFSLQGRLQVRTIKVAFTNTGAFNMEVTPRGRETAVYEYPAAILGGVILGAVPLRTGNHGFLVMTNPAGAKIDIVNATYLPSTFIQASYEGFFTVRSQTSPG